MGYATFAGRRSNLRANQLRRDAAGAVFFADRGKTGTPAGGALSARIPQPYAKEDFRAIRVAEFGEADRRTLADFRCSGAVEAIAGDATPTALAPAMGNTLSWSNALFATYVPVNVSSLRAVAEARRRGRTKLR
jgi:hypothetical protein